MSHLGRRIRSRRLARLRSEPLTYDEVGATSAVLPRNYHPLEVSRRIGEGEAWFRVASERLLTWEMHRRAGLAVFADPRVAPGGVAVLELRIGPWTVAAPVRVIEVIKEATTTSITYGTLPGHPERGEERFTVRLDPNGSVSAEIRAFSRPGRWFTRLGQPIARRMQAATTQRYLAALTDQPDLDGPRRHT